MQNGAVKINLFLLWDNVLYDIGHLQGREKMEISVTFMT